MNCSSRTGSRLRRLPDHNQESLDIRVDGAYLMQVSAAVEAIDIDITQPDLEGLVEEAQEGFRALHAGVPE